MKKTWEDFEVGSKERTASMTVTESHIVSFTGLTGDNYPLHVDEEYAKNTLFKTRIAQGMLVFSVASGLVVQSGFLADSVVGVLGINNLKFLAPVKIGDTIHTEIEVIGKKEASKNNVGLVTMQYKVNNFNEKTVITAELNFMMHRRVKG